jgi:8-oxo-dGTP pyrophosphatase MutT (NUDIX family)
MLRGHLGIIAVSRSAGEMILAAGVILRAKSGRVLVLQRSNAGDAPGLWALPGGHIEKGEDAKTAAIRECLEETGYLLGTPELQILQTQDNDVDYTTFLKNVDDEFVPKLNEEHTSWAWIDPVFFEGKEIFTDPIELK